MGRSIVELCTSILKVIVMTTMNERRKYNDKMAYYNNIISTSCFRYTLFLFQLPYGLEPTRLNVLLSWYLFGIYPKSRPTNSLD